MNYANLSDPEFEYLCKDVMSRKLSTNLQRFGKGQDGGIDLCSKDKNKIVQVKHYVKTDFNGLLSALKKEVLKVDELKPKEYYVCCQKELTPKNKDDIFKLFSKYMESTENIITKLELDEFLEAPENIDIVRKHYKLWLESTNILTDIYSNEIFVDAQALLSDIDWEKKFFVKTRAYDEALKTLEKSNVLIIVGNPGVGKTVISKMLVLYYATQGYRVRYTSDGTDLNALKKSLSQSPDCKEVILLDDCFGQAYFKMKETQENELLQLIKYIKGNRNKLLIMNSRISIYQEAKRKTHNLINSFARKEYQVYILNIEEMSIEEKARIFYNHLYFNDVPNEYYQNIKLNHNYRKIVKHNNYNPRVIEFVCMPTNFRTVMPTGFSDFVMDCLNKPEEIWKNEYEDRLGEADRILLNTLYSLTDTTVSLEMVKACFEYRVLKESSLNSSINHFNQALERLIESMVKIVDDKGNKMLAASNPSVNDFLREYINLNKTEKKRIIDCSISARQLKRMLNSCEYKSRISSLFSDQTILSFVFENEKQKSGFITAWCVKNQILDNIYRMYILDYLRDTSDVNLYEYEMMYINDIWEKLFQKDICEFYRLKEVIEDKKSFFASLECLSLNEIVGIVNSIDWVIGEGERPLYIKEIQKRLRESIEWYCDCVSCGSYYNFVEDAIDASTRFENNNDYISADEAIKILEDMVESAVLEEISDIVSTLPKDINPNDILCSDVNVYVCDAEKEILNYLEDGDDEKDSYIEKVYEEEQILDEIFYR